MSDAAAAERIARAGHEGQVDKTGRPYIEHVERVAAAVAPGLRSIAWLHDVVEDTPMTAEDLAAEGFGPDVVDAVVAITRLDEEEADAYYARVRANPLALAVKVSDLADNSAPERLALVDADTRAHLVAKYDHARRELGLTPA
ncbi:MAG: HD domain-containing protein [Patulibacter minatonensis]